MCGEPKGHIWCYTYLFTNRGVHWTSEYTAGLTSRHPSCKQQRAGKSGRQLLAAVRFGLVLPDRYANRTYLIYVWSTYCWSVDQLFHCIACKMCFRFPVKKRHMEILVASGIRRVIYLLQMYRVKLEFQRHALKQGYSSRNCGIDSIR